MRFLACLAVFSSLLLLTGCSKPEEKKPEPPAPPATSQNGMVAPATDVKPNTVAPPTE